MSRRNYFCIDACLNSISTSRYTPAGIEIMEAKLAYFGQVFEANVFREIHLTIFAIAVGACCIHLKTCQVGKSYRFVGFLAPKKLGAIQIIFHIQKIKIIGGLKL